MKFDSSPSSKISIRRHLIGLVVITVIPVMLFASALVVYLSNERATALEQNLLGTTRALNVAVDEQIVSVVSSLKILSEVEDFHPDSIQYLHKRLRKFVESQDYWSYISFTDTRGNQIFNTSARFGKRLPKFRNDPSFIKMMKTGKTVISGFRKEDKVVTISVPVKKDDVIIYALVGALDIDSLTKLLISQKLPEGWSAAIMDSEANILAHSRRPEVLVGKRASTQLGEKVLNEVDSFFKDTNKNGKKAFGASVHSHITDWTIVLKVPDDGHLFTYWKSIYLIIVGGTILLLLSIWLAMLMGRKISRPIQSLSQEAQALGEGKSVNDIDTSLIEIYDVNVALKSAAIQRSLNEQKINVLYEQAQEAVKLRDTFLSVASHELKTPITALKLQFQLFDKLCNKKEFVSREELQRPIARVHDQVRRLILLIDDLMDATRISAGKMDFILQEFDLVHFVNGVVEQFDQDLAKSGNLITVKGPETLNGLWDRDRLEQVVVNLLTNAIKYGNGKPVTVNILNLDQTAVIEVIDQGIGITKENLSKVFERFERVTEDKSISGLGLGLWIVKGIVEAMGGEISVESEPGTGSKFTLKIPMNIRPAQTATILGLNLSTVSDAHTLQ